MTKFIEYSKELAPIIRKVNALKEELKEFKATDEKFLEHQSYVEDAREILKFFLEGNATSKALLEEISELTKDLKEGFEAAAKGTNFTPAEIGAFLNARAKEEGVSKVISKGTTFEALDNLVA